MAVLRRDLDVFAQKFENGDQVQRRRCDDNLCGQNRRFIDSKGVGSLLTSPRVESGLVEYLDERPLCFAGRGVHLKVSSDEKLASHGSNLLENVDVGDRPMFV